MYSVTPLRGDIRSIARDKDGVALSATINLSFRLTSPNDEYEGTRTEIVPLNDIAHLRDARLTRRAIHRAWTQLTEYFEATDVPDENLFADELPDEETLSVGDQPADDLNGLLTLSEKDAVSTLAPRDEKELRRELADIMQNALVGNQNEPPKREAS